MSVNPRQPGSLTWLHLSDIHFGEKHASEQVAVLNRLLDDVRECREKHGLAPDLIFVTGDIAWSGKSEQYETDAKPFLDKLQVAADLPADRVFLIPGNHDVDRTAVGKLFALLRDDLLRRGNTEDGGNFLHDFLTSPGSKADRSLVLQKHAAYVEFVKNHFPHCAPDGDPAWYARPVEFDGLPFSRLWVVGLNSAWLGGEGEEKGKLVIGYPQLMEALGVVEKKGDPKTDFIVSLAHHPLSWLPEWDERLCGQEIDARCDFHLTGHLHETYLNLRGVNGPQRCSTMAAGSAFGDGGMQWYNGFHFVRLDFQTGKGRAYIREFKKNKFVPNNEFDTPEIGQFEWDLPKRFHPPKAPTPPDSSPINNERTDSTNGLLAEYRETLAEQTGKVRLFGDWKFRKLEEVFVELTIVEEYAAPSKQDEWKGLLDAAVRERVDGEKRSEQNVRRNVKPEELLRDGARAVVVGAPGSGKSTLMRWLASKTLAEGRHLPVFIELKSLPDEALGNGNQGFAGFLFDFGIAPLVQTRLDAHSEEREPLRMSFCQLVERGDVVVFLDGLDEVRDRKFFARLRDLVERFADEKRNGLVVSTRPYDLKPFAGLEAMEIAPLDDRQIAAFLQKYFGDELSKNLTGEFTRRRDVRDLARVPFLLAVIASLYEKKKELVGERLELYRRIVLALGNEIDAEKDIEKFHLTDPDGALKRDFLKFLAYERLFDEKQADFRLRQEFMTDDLVSLCKRFCKEQNLSTDPYLLVADAKATPLLHEIGKDRYAFVHLTVQEYLAAITLAERRDCEKVFCRAFFNPTLAEREVLPMTLGLVGNPDMLYDALERLPESLDFKNLRLRARGLRYVGNLSSSIFSALSSRLMDFLFWKIADQIPFREKILKSFAQANKDYRDQWVNLIFPKLDEHEDEDMVLAAMDGLGEFGDNRVVSTLAKFLDSRPYFVTKAAQALGKIGGEEAEDKLIKAVAAAQKALIYNGAEAQWFMVDALAKIGSQKAIPVLLEKLKLEPSLFSAPFDEFVPERAIYAIDCIGEWDENIRLSLLKLLPQLQYFPGVRRIAQIFIRKIGGMKEAEKLLIDNHVSDSDERLLMVGGRNLLKKMVDSLKDKTTMKLPHQFNPIKLPEDAPITELIYNLNSQNYNLVQASADVILNLTEVKKLEGLSLVLSSTNLFVRKKSTEVIGYYSLEESLLVELQKLATTDPVEEVRATARDAMERYKLKLKYFDKEVPELFESVGRESAFESSYTYVSHELRNILSPLKAYAWKLDRNLSDGKEMDAAQAKAIAERIIGQTDLAFQAVDRYLDYSKPLVPSLQTTDIQALLCDCLREVEPELAAVSIQAKCAFESLPKISVDPELLRDAVRNVLRNAIEAMKDGGTLTVSGSTGDQSVVIAIGDTGPGINPDHLNRVFDLGFSTKADKHGSGIGLALVQRIIRDVHRGRVTATNNFGGPGATIRIELPIVEEKSVNGKSTV